MGLLERAHARRQERERDSRELDESWDRRTSAEVARAVNYRLELKGDDAIKPEQMRKLGGGWEDSLWEFKVDGLTFIAGFYWHGNPGSDFYLAVRKSLWAPKPEWPMPHRRAISYTNWAPKGYRPIPSLADLAHPSMRGTA